MDRTTPTPWELKELEAPPKTALRRVIDRVVCSLPVIAAALLLLQYNLADNYKFNTITNVYNWFIGFFTAVFLAYFIVSLFSKRAYEKLLHASPLYTVIFIILALYDYATLKTGKLPLPYFPWPDRIINALIQDRVLLLDCIGNSLKLLFTGYFYGVAVGLITGITAGVSKKIRYWVSPIIKLLGPIPSTTWLPIILIVASSLFGGSVFLIALGVWYPVTMTAMNGVLNVERANFEVARTFGANRARLIFRVAVPAASPHIFQGLTQGMSVACTALMVAEMMGVESGLGWYINWQKGWAEFAKMYAAVIVICVTFSIVNILLTQLKRRVLRWQEGGEK